MSKKKWIVLGILLLVFIFISFFVFDTLQNVNAPKVTVKIDVLELTKDNVSLNISMKLDNQNPYAMILEDMKLTIMTPEKELIGELTFPKKTIQSNKEIAIYTEGSFGFNNQPLEELHTHIDAEFGIDFFEFISISIPLDIDIITDPQPVIDVISFPSISMSADIGTIDETGVLVNGTILVNNQNHFLMELSNTDIIIKHNNIPISADIIVTDSVIEPQSISPITFSAFVGYDVFNNGVLSAVLTGDVTVIVGGISMKRSFTTSAQMDIPDIASYLMNNERIEISLSADFDITMNGVNMNVGLKLYNPTNVPLIASDFDIIIYRVDNDNKTKIAEDILENCPVPPRSEVCLKDSFKLPVISFFPYFGEGIPDWFLLTLIGDFKIANSTQCIPVQINGFLSGKIF